MIAARQSLMTIAAETLIVMRGMVFPGACRARIFLKRGDLGSLRSAMHAGRGQEVMTIAAASANNIACGVEAFVNSRS